MNSQLVKCALESILRMGSPGDVAFARCFERKEIEDFLADPDFAVSGWELYGIGETSSNRWIEADRAVDLRESKGMPVLLLVDTSGAGAGMDGIYSSSREITEDAIVADAKKLAMKQVVAEMRPFAKEAVRVASRIGGRRRGVAGRQELRFLGDLIADPLNAGRHVATLGLWPIASEDPQTLEGRLVHAALMVERLLLAPATSQAPQVRVDGLILRKPSPNQFSKLDKLLREAAGRPADAALDQVKSDSSLWLGNLTPAFMDQTLGDLESVSWRKPNGALYAWSGLVLPDGEMLPHLYLEKNNSKSKLEVRWRAKPEGLPRGAVNYEVKLLAGEDVLASRQVEHRLGTEQKATFSVDDFDDEMEDAFKIEACVEVTALGQDDVPSIRSEDIIVTNGNVPDTQRTSVGEVFRCLADGLAQADTTDALHEFVEQRQAGKQGSPDKKGYLSCRLNKASRGFRIERPPLLEHIENTWRNAASPVCRWVVRSRPDGFWTSPPVPLEIDHQLGEAELTRLVEVTKRMREDCQKGGGILSRFYAHGHSSSQLIADYLNGWQAALDNGSPELALANTVEVQNPSGKTVGLIVMPHHVGRLAWQCGYDALMIQLHITEKLGVRQTRRVLESLDGAHFPFALPGLTKAEAFVFGDLLGFSAVAMVSIKEREPKAAISSLAACYMKNAARTVTVLTSGTAEVLGGELSNYLDCHLDSTIVSVQALRAGDGSTVLRALGNALYSIPQGAVDLTDQEESENAKLRNVAFKLHLVSEEAQSSVSGRYLAQLSRRRRAGSQHIPDLDKWCQESLPLSGGRLLPRLRWSRREDIPGTAAHLAIAFDTFASTAEVLGDPEIAKAPLLSFGLLAPLKRTFGIQGSLPFWRITATTDGVGEKLTDRIVTDRILKTSESLTGCVTRHLGGNAESHLGLRTEADPEDLERVKTLHRIADWVISIDRNAGVELFDSPRDKTLSDLYDAYLIDAVPERDDLGCLQLITSTAHFDEVRQLLTLTLADLGLSNSRRNCDYLLNQLKALSGRLAMRLAGRATEASQIRVGSEIMGLAVARAACHFADTDDAVWPALSNGFLVPLDDINEVFDFGTLESSDDDAPLGDENLESRPSRRADLLYVGLGQRQRLALRFLEVKFRRHLVAARSPELAETALAQVMDSRTLWDSYFGSDDVSPSALTLHSAKMYRILHFYLEKARRHNLSEDTFQKLSDELQKWVGKPSEYSFVEADAPDRAMIFCPEFEAASPERLQALEDNSSEAWLFGPGTISGHPLWRETTASTPTTARASSIASDAVPKSDPTEPPPIPPATKLVQPSDISSPREIPAEQVAAKEAVVNLGKDQSGDTVRWSLSTRGNPHLMIVGLPGTGKTTCLVNICKHLIDQQVWPIIFSYHDDIDERISGLSQNVSSIDYRRLGFNPLRVAQPSPHAHIECAGLLRDIFAAIFPRMGEIQMENLRSAVKRSYEEAGWSKDLTSQPPVPKFNRFVELLRAGKQDASTQALNARLSELSDFGFFEAEDGSGNILDHKGPLIVRVHAAANDLLQQAYASFILYRIYQDMFRRGRQSELTHAVIFDEAHRAGRLRLIPTMAKESRKFGISLLVSSQEARDFDDSLFSAIANFLVLKVNEQDAKLLAKNASSSDTERQVADRLKSLQPRQALFFHESARRPRLVNLANV